MSGPLFAPLNNLVARPSTVATRDENHLWATGLRVGALCVFWEAMLHHKAACFICVVDQLVPGLSCPTYPFHHSIAKGIPGSDSHSFPERHGLETG